MKRKFFLFIALCSASVMYANQTADTIYLSNANFSNFLSNYGTTAYPDSGYYKVTEDIDTIWANVLGGAYDYDTYTSEHDFKGTFDGVGHTIYVTRTKNQSGLFKVVAKTGTIKNLRIVGDMSPEGDKNEALVVLHNNGTVENIVVYGNLLGGIFHTPAGIVSENAGTVKNCAFHGYVEGSGAGYCNNWYGGLIGQNDATLENSIYIGHLFEDRTLADIDIGGALIGLNSSRNVKSSFFNTDSCYHSIGENNVTISNLSFFAQQADSLMNLDFYKRAGWDISDEPKGTSIWYLESDGTTYPHLRFEMAGPVTVNETNGGTTQVYPSHKMYLKGDTVTISIDLDFGYTLKGWFVNDSLIRTSGDLTLSVTKEYTITPQIIYGAGIENTFSDKISIYPTLVKNNLNIAGLETLTGIATLEIYTLTGDKLLQQQISSSTNSEINIDQLSSGMYIVKLSHTQGSKQWKIIKQ